jgi:hypothetical protein
VLSDDYYSATQSGKQFGAGLWGAVHEEKWTLEDMDADILFYVDHSGSMLDNATALADNFETFIDHLNDYSSDWRIIVADNAAGCNVGGVLSPSMSDYATRFEDAVTGTATAKWDEAGLMVGALAVEATDAGECNDNFLRDGALLHLILVSDEPEQSGTSWSDLVDRIAAKKGDPSLVRVSAIAGTAADAATGSGCEATEGIGYEDAVAATGGTFLSFCSDWAASMMALADDIVTQDTFQLTALDVAPVSVEVTVDGQPATGWSFDAATNSVVFANGFAPTQGSTVAIDYGTYAVCE